MPTYKMLEKIQDAKNKELWHLDLSNLELIITDLAKLSSFLPDMPLIRKLSISNNLIGYPLGVMESSDLRKLVVDFVHAIRRSNITNINLDNCGFSGVTLGALFDTLRNCRNLRVLYFCGNELNERDCKVIANFIHSNDFLTEIYLDENGIDNDGGMLILSNLARNSTLRSLSLSKNKIGAVAMHAFAKWQQSTTLLEALSLDHNPIGEIGAINLALYLSQVKFGKMLSLNNCGLKDIGTAVLVEAITLHQFITKLDLSDNGIEDVTPFAKLLSSNTRLTHLDLNNNPVKIGIGALCIALSSNTGLDILLLSNTGLYDCDVQKIVKALSTNDSLGYVGLEGNNLSNETKKDLLQLSDDSQLNKRRKLDLTVVVDDDDLSASSEKSGSEVIGNLTREPQDNSNDKSSDDDSIKYSDVEEDCSEQEAPKVRAMVTF